MTTHSVETEHEYDDADLPDIFDGAKLLEKNRSMFSRMFDKFDADKDGQLNATELREFFSYLFDDPVCTEHLFHFENKYLMQYGENGCLSKVKFFNILEDYEKAYGYSLNEDIHEFYYHVLAEGEHKIAVTTLCQVIAAMLPHDIRYKMRNFMDYMTRMSKGSAADVTLDAFKTAICALFHTTQRKQTKSQLVASANDASTVRHPFYRELVAERVLKYESGLPDLDSVRPMLDRVIQELEDISATNSGT